MCCLWFGRGCGSILQTLGALGGTLDLLSAFRCFASLCFPPPFHVLPLRCAHVMLQGRCEASCRLLHLRGGGPCIGNKKGPNQHMYRYQDMVGMQPKQTLAFSGVSSKVFGGNGLGVTSVGVGSTSPVFSTSMPLWSSISMGKVSNCTQTGLKAVRCDVNDRKQNVLKFLSAHIRNIFYIFYKES